ncbi:MAG: LytR/AlgR family response regulator transcription factor [Sphingomonadaceae bacterium]
MNSLAIPQTLMRAPFVVVATALGAIVLFTAYCQAHSWFDTQAVPITISLQWGLAMGLPTAAAGQLVWQQEARLADLAWRGPVSAVALWAGLLAAGAFVGATGHLLAGGHAFDGNASTLLKQMYDLMPEAAALAGFVVCFLLFRRALAAPLRANDAEWITFPEAPTLHLKLADIRLIRSAGNYCEIHGRDRAHLVRMTMMQAIDRLKPHGFVRIHRTLIVNIAHIVDIDRSPRNRDTAVRINSGERLPIGRTYVAELIESVPNWQAPPS